MEQFVQGNFWHQSLSGSGTTRTSGTATLLQVAGAAAVVAVAASDFGFVTEAATVTKTIIEYVPQHTESALEVGLKVSGTLGIGQNVEWTYHHFVTLAHLLAPLVVDFAQYTQKLFEQHFI